jgi:lipoate-protein ligase B
MSAWAIYFENPQPYQACAQLQDRLVAARIAGKIPDLVLFVEHPPVVTLGRRGRDNYVKVSREDLAARGIALVHSSRGGDVTYHGPGQVVMYPIMQLGDAEADARGYMGNLEEIAIRTAADFGVKAFRREGMNGAWTDAGKIAAIGFRLQKWVTSHGLSFNVDVDLSGFETIVPCGLEGEPVTSLKFILSSACPALAGVRKSMTRHFEAVCGRKLEVFREGAKLPGDFGLFVAT